MYDSVLYFLKARVGLSFERIRFLSSFLQVHVDHLFLQIPRCAEMKEVEV